MFDLKESLICRGCCLLIIRFNGLYLFIILAVKCPETVKINLSFTLKFNFVLLLLCSLLSELIPSLCLNHAVLHDNALVLLHAAWLVLTWRVLLTLPACFRVLRPQCEVVENDRTCDGHVQGCSLVRVLRNVHEVVTDGNLIFVKPTALVAKHEKGISAEGCLLNGS